MQKELYLVSNVFCFRNSLTKQRKSHLKHKKNHNFFKKRVHFPDFLRLTVNNNKLILQQQIYTTMTTLMTWVKP